MRLHDHVTEILDIIDSVAEDIDRPPCSECGRTSIPGIDPPRCLKHAQADGLVDGKGRFARYPWGF